MYCSDLAGLVLQVAKAHPNDRDARMKFTECNKIVKRIAFEKAISVADTRKSVVDQINLESMSMVFYMHHFIFIEFVLLLYLEYVFFCFEYVLLCLFVFLFISA